MLKNDTTTHDHGMNHGVCLFVSKVTYENVKYVVSMSLVLIRPNRGADKMEPFIRFFGAHHTLPYSSVKCRVPFYFKTGRGTCTVQTSTGRGSK